MCLLFTEYSKLLRFFFSVAFRFDRRYWRNPSYFLFLRLIICLNLASIRAWFEIQRHRCHCVPAPPPHRISQTHRNTLTQGIASALLSKNCKHTHTHAHQFRTHLQHSQPPANAKNLKHLHEFIHTHKRTHTHTWNSNTEPRHTQPRH